MEAHIRNTYVEIVRQAEARLQLTQGPALEAHQKRMAEAQARFDAAKDAANGSAIEIAAARNAFENADAASRAEYGRDIADARREYVATVQSALSSAEAAERRQDAERAEAKEAAPAFLPPFLRVI